ncbi:MAG: alpha-galactosidase [Clostridia bacterium]|nr:alpha-galactosidase [Clostridia bacterium]
MIIRIIESGLRVVFRIDDERRISFVDFSEETSPEKLLEEKKGVVYPFLGVHISGNSTKTGPSFKHDSGSETQEFRYVSHEITENEKGKLFVLKAENGSGLTAVYHMQFYPGVKAVRTYTTLINEGSESIRLEHVTSFMYYGIGKNGLKPYYEKTEVFVPRNSWCNEAQWTGHDVRELGLSNMAIRGYNLPRRSLTRFSYGTTSSWSSGEYLPMGIATDTETGECFFFEIDFSGSWEAEYGSGFESTLYLALLGPDKGSFWWKTLKPGESFTTVPAAFGVCCGNETSAVAELTKYRRSIRRPNIDDRNCHVVFNDYMNCLFGDPTEEKEKNIIDKAAELGCEYYCMDAGWYDDGSWWDRIGEWKESSGRFPNGMKSVYDYAESRGIKMGMWLEIECMGVKCALADKLPDSWFVQSGGKRLIDQQRYLLDFRNPYVRNYCSAVIDRLINDYGCEYFKIDYNCTIGPGSDYNTESMGQAMYDHYCGYYSWLEEIYAKYPDLIIENCGSGAQRMDYGILSYHSLQSTSDETDYINNAYIAANVACAVTPEQGGMWVYPYEENDEHIIFNMVNGLLLRPYISGLVWKLSDDEMRLFKEGIDVYKSIRSDIPSALPFFPLGFGKVTDPVLAYGLDCGDHAYLSVFCIDSETISVPLNFDKREVKKAEVIYPSIGNCDVLLSDGVLTVTVPQKKAARLIKLTF